MILAPVHQRQVDTFACGGKRDTRDIQREGTHAGTLAGASSEDASGPSCRLKCPRFVLLRFRIDEAATQGTRSRDDVDDGGHRRWHE